MIDINEPCPITDEQIIAAQVALTGYLAERKHHRKIGANFCAKTTLQDMLFLIGQELDDDYRGDATAFERFKQTLREVLA